MAESKENKRSEAHKKKKLSEKFLAHSFKAKGDEPCVAKVTFRMPVSLKERIEKFKEQEGRMPWDEVRAYLDEILPE